MNGSSTGERNQFCFSKDALVLRRPTKSAKAEKAMPDDIQRKKYIQVTSFIGSKVQNSKHELTAAMHCYPTLYSLTPSLKTHTPPSALQSNSHS